MTALNSITSRLETLEKSENKDRTLIFVEYEGASVRETTRHAYNQCEKSCDPDIFAKALREATKRNPAKENRKDIIVITEEVMLDVVQRLKEEGIEVRL